MILLQLNPPPYLFSAGPDLSARALIGFEQKQWNNTSQAQQDITLPHAALLFFLLVDHAWTYAGQDEGESVFVDGVKDVTLRLQLAAFLSALGLADLAGKGDKPQGFRCTGGGVLQGVADLMDERDLAEAPPLDREAAFQTAREVRRRGGSRRKCQRCESNSQRCESNIASCANRNPRS